MKPCMFILLGCLTGCLKLLPLDFMGPVGIQTNSDLLMKLKSIPTSEIEFKISSKKNQVKIVLSSKFWKIEGFGTGTNDHQVIIHSVVGSRDINGSSKEYVYSRSQGNKTTIIITDQNERQRVVGLY